MKILTLLIFLIHSVPALGNWNTTDEELLELQAVDQAALFLKEQEREAKILQSIEALDNNSDFLEMERLQQHDKKQLNKREFSQDLLQEEALFDAHSLRGELDKEFDEAELIDEDFVDEGFDFLDAEIDLLNEELLDEDNTKNTKEKAKQLEKKSVGIKGKEEALINKLDNSDLMDFEKDIEIWRDDLKVLDDDDGINGHD
ncbi:hypothetical protein [Thalassotalea atypica]|uniref:hypothetical protein n=1 Tax=Thalassotalea atypica TaxID=2054316 RepID=UPI0025730EC8|nr:hypothetical protein [Thalassotalea atypica]